MVGSTGSKLAAGWLSLSAGHGGGPRRPGGTQFQTREGGAGSGAHSSPPCDAGSTPLDATNAICILLFAERYALAHSSRVDIGAVQELERSVEK